MTAVALPLSGKCVHCHTSGGGRVAAALRNTTKTVQLVVTFYMLQWWLLMYFDNIAHLFGGLPLSNMKSHALSAGESA